MEEEVMKMKRRCLAGCGKAEEVMKVKKVEQIHQHAESQIHQCAEESLQNIIDNDAE